jgi:hypothetical protein
MKYKVIYYQKNGMRVESDEFESLRLDLPEIVREAIIKDGATEVTVKAVTEC